VAVTTTGQSKEAGKPKKPLRAPVFDGSEVSCDEVKQLQASWVDLQKYFRLAESQESVKSGKIGTVSYELRKGLQYRIYKVPDRSDVKSACCTG